MAILGFKKNIYINKYKLIQKRLGDSVVKFTEIDEHLEKIAIGFIQHSHQNKICKIIQITDVLILLNIFFGV